MSFLYSHCKGNIMAPMWSILRPMCAMGCTKAYQTTVIVVDFWGHPTYLLSLKTLMEETLTNRWNKLSSFPKRMKAQICQRQRFSLGKIINSSWGWMQLLNLILQLLCPHSLRNNTDFVSPWISSIQPGRQKSMHLSQTQKDTCT